MVLEVKNIRMVIGHAKKGYVADEETTSFAQSELDALLARVEKAENELSVAKENDLREYEYWTGVRWQIISPRTIAIRKKSAALQDLEGGKDD